MQLIKKIFDYILSFLESEKGETSSRRLAGLLLVLAGMSAKLFLILYGAKIKLIANFTLYPSLDNTADSMIITGALLLGSTIIDKFKNK